jgi:hypothetical protein
LSRVYSNIENLVLRARPEKIGCAVKKYAEKMEHWNVGILKSRVWRKRL